MLSPIVVAGLPDAEVQSLVCEPLSARRQREFLSDRLEKLEAGDKVLRDVMKTAIA